MLGMFLIRKIDGQGPWREGHEKQLNFLITEQRWGWFLGGQVSGVVGYIAITFVVDCVVPGCFYVSRVDDGC